MKQITDKLHFALLLIAACLFVSCTDDYDEADGEYYPSTEYYGYDLLDVKMFTTNGSSIDNYSFSGGTSYSSLTWYQYLYVSCYEGFPWRLTETPEWATFSSEEGVGPEDAIALTVYDNPSTKESRSATFYAESRLEEFPLRRVHTIFQQAHPLYFEYSPNDYAKTHYFESEGGTLTYTITTNQDWHIRVPSGQKDFVTFSQYEGTGNATLTITVPPYDYLDGTMLKNTFYIYTGTADNPGSQKFYFYINQYAPSGSTVVEEAVEFAKEGGSQTLSIGNATSYTVSNSYSWLSVTPTSGEGEVELTISALPNNTLTERSGTVQVKVGSSTRARITVTQKAHFFNLLDKEIAFEAGGGVQSVLLLGSSGAWEASSNASWLTVSPSTGEAVGTRQTITFTAAENNSLDSRTAKVTFKRTDGVTGTLTQTVTQTGHYFSAGDWANGAIVGPDAQTAELDFKGDLSWTASTTDSWITLLTTSGSASSNKVSFSVTANTAQESRTGAIVIAYEGGQTKIPVVQESAYLNTSSATIEIPSTGGGHQTFVSSNAAWTVSVDATWLKPSVTSGTGNIEVTFTADDNASATDRTATVTFTLGVDGTQKKMVITQKARYMNVPVSVVNFFKRGGTQTYYIDTDGTPVASSSDSWLTASVDKGKLLTLTVSENSAATDRSATVTISLTGLQTGEIKHTITVNQLNSNVFEYEDYGDDTSIDQGANGAITIGKGEYGSDKPLDGGLGNSITIDKTGYGEDKELNN